MSSGAAKAVDIASGIRLIGGEDLPPLEWWIVMDATDGEVVAQVSSSWGHTPLPPGQYRIEVPLPDETVSSARIDVAANEVTDVALADLGVGRVVLEMPDPGIEFLFGKSVVTPILVVGDERYNISSARQGEEVAMWFKSRPIVLERRAGSFVDLNSVDVVAGNETRIPFDLETIIEERGLSVFELERGMGGARAERMTVVAARGDRALLAKDAPRIGVRYVGDGWCRGARSGPDGRQRIKSLAIGKTERLRVPTGGESEGGGDVSLAVEQPHDGAELDAGALTTTVIGQASRCSGWSDQDCDRDRHIWKHGGPVGL